MKYLVYCDGSTKANGQVNAVGGWAYALLSENYGTLSAADSGGEIGTTNQRMELTAAIKALERVMPMVGLFDEVEICTDSAYLHNCYAQGWYRNWQMNGWKNSKKQPVANQDLWELLVPYFETANVKFTKVKGHADNVWNNYVDDLAQTAAARLQEKMNASNSN